MNHWTENDFLHWLYTGEGDAAVHVVLFEP